MLGSIFKKSSIKTIKQYLVKGKLNKETPIDLIEGLAYYIKLFLKEGFTLTQIKEVASVGQIVADKAILDKIKNELISGTFKGGYYTDNFDIKENYIDFLQFTLDNGESYAVAYNSPGDYLGTYVGILWILKLDKRLEIGMLPNTHLDFRRS